MGDDAIVIEVPKGEAERLRRDLASRGLVDVSLRITKDGDSILIPVTARPSIPLAEYGARVRSGRRLPPRIRPRDPRTRLRAELEAAGIPIEAAPWRWERIGDVLVLRIPPAGKAHSSAIAELYGRVLHARAVVVDRSGIHGPLRTPDTQLLWGEGTETIHTEHGVRYQLDVARLMFSSGNLAERIGIPERIRSGDVVVDLFAGIGYFSLPIAVHSRPSVVYACELNPVSFAYLVENIRLNRADSVVPLLGDCRETAPRGVADWVLMGHFDARTYVDVAFQCLRQKGTILYHELCPREQFPDALVRRLSAAARANWRRVSAAKTRIVKSYAPGIVHAVVEAKIEMQTRGPRFPATPSDRAARDEGRHPSGNRNRFEFRSPRPFRCTMNCPKCGAGVPVGASYCPSCGAPRSEIDRLLREAARTAKRAIDAGVSAVDRAVKAIDPVIVRADQAAKPVAAMTVRIAKEAADKAASSAKPAIAKAAEKTERVARKVKERARKRG